jgi:hypothetical protein
VVYDCNPSYLGGRGPEDRGSRPARAESVRYSPPPTQPIAGQGGSAPVILAQLGGSRSRPVQAGLGIKAIPYLKNNHH